MSATLTAEEKKKARLKRARDKYRSTESGRAKEAAYGKEYRHTHKEQISLKSAQYKKKNPEKIKRIAAKWRAKEKNREDAKIRTRKWVSENQERAFENRRTYYRATRDARIAATIQWQRNNPERARITFHNYRARKRASGKLSKGLIEILFSEQGGKCAYCFCDLNQSRYHLDHFIPLALGGRNEDSNIVIACASCNCSKRHTHPLKFLDRIGAKR